MKVRRSLATKHACVLVLSVFAHRRCPSFCHFAPSTSVEEAWQRARAQTTVESDSPRAKFAKASWRSSSSLPCSCTTAPLSTKTGGGGGYVRVGGDDHNAASKRLSVGSHRLVGKPTSQAQIVNSHKMGFHSCILGPPNGYQKAEGRTAKATRRRGRKTTLTRSRRRRLSLMIDRTKATSPPGQATSPAVAISPVAVSGFCPALRS